MTVRPAAHRLSAALAVLAIGVGVAAPAADARGGVRLVGTAGPDTLRGGPGDDVIAGNGGGDRLYGAGGADTLLGGAGPDHIYPGRGSDVVVAGAGNDVIRARGGGVDQISCGPGRDTAYVDARDRVGGDCERVVRG